eukprot:1593577-Rhodomonas_salina.1
MRAGEGRGSWVAFIHVDSLTRTKTQPAVRVRRGAPTATRTHITSCSLPTRNQCRQLMASLSRVCSFRSSQRGSEGDCET